MATRPGAPAALNPTLVVEGLPVPKAGACSSQLHVSGDGGSTRILLCFDAMRCDAMRCDATRCDAIRCDAMRCDACACCLPLSASSVAHSALGGFGDLACALQLHRQLLASPFSGLRGLALSSFIGARRNIRPPLPHTNAKALIEHCTARPCGHPELWCFKQLFFSGTRVLRRDYL